MNLGEITAKTIGPLVSEIQQRIARINTVWGKEHQADGAHILPNYRDVVFGTDIGASNFRASGTMTWTVSASTVETLQWWKHGDCYHIEFRFIGTTVGGAASLSLLFDAPGGFLAHKIVLNKIRLVDGGAAADGHVFTTAQSGVLTIQRTDGANFTAGSVNAQGEITFRTTA